ncbi:hypothetical protein BJV74DRAFT_113616 [Russula compacta]|nr:hypothetical protein BJV74DRAFT_113616 [Russula compacta]
MTHIRRGRATPPPSLAASASPSASALLSVTESQTHALFPSIRPAPPEEKKKKKKTTALPLSLIVLVFGRQPDNSRAPPCPLKRGTSHTRACHTLAGSGVHRTLRAGTAAGRVPLRLPEYPRSLIAKFTKVAQNITSKTFFFNPTFFNLVFMIKMMGSREILRRGRVKQG